jgi:hypothetical protein
MATARTQDVTITRRELDRLERDREILDWIEADHAGRYPGRPSLRDQVGGLIEAGESLDAIIARGLRRLEAPGASRRPSDRRRSARTG